MIFFTQISFILWKSKKWINASMFLGIELSPQIHVVLRSTRGMRISPMALQAQSIPCKTICMHLDLDATQPIMALSAKPETERWLSREVQILHDYFAHEDDLRTKHGKMIAFSWTTFKCELFGAWREWTLPIARIGSTRQVSSISHSKQWLNTWWVGHKFHTQHHPLWIDNPNLSLFQSERMKKITMIYLPYQLPSSSSFLISFGAHMHDQLRRVEPDPLARGKQ